MRLRRHRERLSLTRSRSSSRARPVHRPTCSRAYRSTLFRDIARSPLRHLATSRGARTGRVAGRAKISSLITLYGATRDYIIRPPRGSWKRAPSEKLREIECPARARILLVGVGLVSRAREKYEPRRSSPLTRREILMDASDID